MHELFQELHRVQNCATQINWNNTDSLKTSYIARLDIPLDNVYFYWLFSSSRMYPY